MNVFGVIGDPVDHSLSPPMHRAAYAASGIDADYSRFPVRDGEDAVEAAVAGARALGMDGLNVTIPHKQAVAELDGVSLTGTARRIGAVNTLDIGDGSSDIEGHNTDARGAVGALEHHGVALDGVDAVVLGAGGAARAIAWGLADRVEAIAVANRTAERAEALADDLEGVEASGHGLEALGELLRDADLLVNATSVGMEEDASPVPAEHLHGDLVVFDAVYTPRMTRLLRDADAAGATTVTGDWMLVYQGAEAFEIWTGESAPVEAMHEALLDGL